MVNFQLLSPTLHFAKPRFAIQYEYKQVIGVNFSVIVYILPKKGELI
ncbi:hypothetical protein VCHA43P273_120088 [Vibrio chagasii]|nr:hypothetical protein VCHA28O22_11051 [Vibrio chagasii]CAH6936126.1 hypothetical protein VCHA43P273_120088 [Vibrio chagasii]CAH7175924.1 hypothetical protein VCHA53O474_11055 [Vibrio chagasii]CAH7303083.1 hypothetical protein VCHA50O393_40297 [Vibrio chagasii]CAH7464857.1 hypothetical protein VCHA37O177_60056 [Vibrio chagasii]